MSPKRYWKYRKNILEKKKAEYSRALHTIEIELKIVDENILGDKPLYNINM